MVQMYIVDIVASIAPPVKKLKGFQKIFLKKGETRQVNFTIGAKELEFYNGDLQKIVEAGDFKVQMGTNSRDVKEASFQLIK